VFSGGMGAYIGTTLGSTFWKRAGGGDIVSIGKKINAICSVIINLYILYKQFPTKPFEL